jgi:hypothetical protein
VPGEGEQRGVVRPGQRQVGAQAVDDRGAARLLVVELEGGQRADPAGARPQDAEHFQRVVPAAA